MAPPCPEPEIDALDAMELDGCSSPPPTQNVSIKLDQSMPLLASPERGKLHKRRASMQLDRSALIKSTPFGVHSDLSGPAQLLFKRVRADDASTVRLSTPLTLENVTLPTSDPLYILATAAAAQTSVTTPPSASHKSSTPSAPTRRIILLNHPLATPLAFGTPGFKFSILTALASHTDVLLNVVRYLPPRTLLYLYSMSASFHYVMNSHFTQFILAGTKTWAPQAEMFYPWRCYRELCMDDPALRRPGKWKQERFLDRKTGKKVDESLVDPANDRGRVVSGSSTSSTGSNGVVKAVPGFRWLKMVVYRELVAREIVAWLAVGGHRTPVTETIDAVKKLWFLMDIPVSAPRVALVHNTAYITNQVLYVLTMFFIKLDMFWTDPICYTGGEFVMREFLLAERTLTTLWNYLRGADGTSRLEVLRLWVKHGYIRPERRGPETREVQELNDQKAKMPILGIPAHLVGRGGFEAHGLGRQRLIRPDELVLREGVKRGLELQRHWIRMICWGFLDGDLQTLPPVRAEDVVLSLRQRRAREEETKGQRGKAREEEAGGTHHFDGHMDDVREGPAAYTG